MDTCQIPELHNAVAEGSFSQPLFSDAWQQLASLLQLYINEVLYITNGTLSEVLYPLHNVTCVMGLWYQ